VASALCPGSFDPATNGHLDIIRRTSRLFDEFIVAVTRNPGKTPLFTLEERQEMLREATADLPNVKIKTLTQLVVDFARSQGCDVIVKGLRFVSDFDNELQQAHMNYALGKIDTFFVVTSPKHSFLSSSLIKEVARFGGDVSSMVPPSVLERLQSKFKETAS
jgi:pantetheine-phosphate adenylyltransferase